jgi:hypothetical protein
MFEIVTDNTSDASLNAAEISSAISLSSSPDAG